MILDRRHLPPCFPSNHFQPHLAVTISHPFNKTDSTHVSTILDPTNHLPFTTRAPNRRGTLLGVEMLTSAPFLPVFSFFRRFVNVTTAPGGKRQM
jgi:hypothetical protein